MRMNDEQETSSLADGFEQPQKSNGIFQQQKESFLSGIDSISNAIHQAKDNFLKDNQNSKMADYANSLETNIGDFKNWVNDLTMDKALQTAREFARKRPEVMLLGVFGAGLFLGRFLKASGESLTNFSSARQDKNTYTSNQEVH